MTVATAMVAPMFTYAPPRVDSLAVKVGRVCASVGRELDAEQLHAVDVLTGFKGDGSPAALEACVVSARQNLKTFVLEAIALTLLLDHTNPVTLGIWSAQQFDVAQETFRHFADLFDSDDFPHLKRRLKRIVRGNGEEEIELTGGQRLKFKARSGKGGRGLTGDFVVLDEAFALEASHMGALLPTLSTRRRAMVFYGSSAGKSDSAILRSIRDRGRAGGPGAPAYVEWCAPGTFADPGCRLPACPHDAGLSGCVLDDESYWLRANPAMGRRITVDYLRTERRALPPHEFARERLGWWDEPDLAGDALLAAWAGCFDGESLAVGRPAFGVDVSGGSRSAAVVAATPGGHLEVVAHRPGVEWLPEFLGGVCARQEPFGVWLDPSGPAGALLPLLADYDVTALQVTAREMGQACEAFSTRVTERSLHHLGDPILNRAIAGASRRDIGDGLWSWSRRRSEVDICPIVAATLAVYGLALNTGTDYDLLNSVY